MVIKNDQIIEIDIDAMQAAEPASVSSDFGVEVWAPPNHDKDDDNASGSNAFYHGPSSLVGLVVGIKFMIDTLSAL